MTDDASDEQSDVGGSPSGSGDRPASDPLDWPNSDGRDRSDGDDISSDVSGRSDGDSAGSHRASGDTADTDRVSRSVDTDRDDRSLDDRADAPLGELASSVRDRSDSDSRPTDDELFEEQDVTPIDTDAVWDRLEAEESTGSDSATSVREERVIEKRSYCERCPFFSAPPAVQCSHEGTSILELVDGDHFRVADCPKVAETERLEEL